jgi:hypothetical protein
VPISGDQVQQAVSLIGAPNGRRYRVEACERHRPALDEGGTATA